MISALASRLSRKRQAGLWRQHPSAPSLLPPWVRLTHTGPRESLCLQALIPSSFQISPWSLLPSRQHPAASKTELGLALGRRQFHRSSFHTLPLLALPGRQEQVSTWQNSPACQPTASPGRRFPLGLSCARRQSAYLHRAGPMGGQTHMPRRLARSLKC